MKSEDIVFYLTNYKKIKQAIVNREEQIIICNYRSKRKIELNEEIESLINLIEKVHSRVKDEEKKKIFEKIYINNMKNKDIIEEIYMSESAFFKVKNELKGGVLLACAATGLLELENILNNL